MGRALALQTRSGWHIPNELRDERPPEKLRMAVRLVGESHPDARLRSITFTYNCAGLIVANRRCWVDPEHVIKALEEDGYRRLSDETQAEKGDVVIYHDTSGAPVHFAIIWHKRLIEDATQTPEIEVISKWGEGGEYIHEMRYVNPLLGKPAEFWTDRRII